MYKINCFIKKIVCKMSSIAHFTYSYLFLNKTNSIDGRRESEILVASSQQVAQKWGLAMVLIGMCFLTGCVNQNQGNPELLENAQEEYRVAATSVAVVTICDRLGIKLVGVPKSTLEDTTGTHPDAVVIGSPMAPDIEILTQLRPDYVLSPLSLMEDLKPKYEAASLQYAFLNLKSVKGMYKSIEELGILFHREEKAGEMVDEFLDFYQAYQDRHAGQKGPKVLLLMGLPGSYVVATENSYAGSLVELAGGQNVYAGTDKEFLNVNAEDMLQTNPDIILRTAHAMPEEVMEMFAEEFETNDTWKHFEAVQGGRVYDLDTSLFGMSANFDYPQALVELEKIFYETDAGEYVDENK